MPSRRRSQRPTTPSRDQHHASSDESEGEARAPARASRGTAASEQSRREREFGDLMALEGQTSHVSTIILLMYGAIAAYSLLSSVLTGGRWWTQLAFYFAGLVAFYAWHAMAHTRLFSQMYHIHMQHHLKRFPPGNFYGKPGTVKREYGFDCPTLWQLMDPRASTYFTLAHEGPLYLFMGAILVVARVWLGASWGQLAAALVLYGVMGSVGSALHASFHVKGFELEKYEWYMELRALHYIHHLGNMRHNFAVLNLGLDGFFRSLALVDPLHSKGSGSGDIADQVHDTDLPRGVDRPRLNRVRSSAGVAAYLLGFNHAPSHVGKHGSDAVNASSRGYPTVLLRIVLVAAGVWLWFATQDSLGISHGYNAATGSLSMTDPGHVLLTPMREWLAANPDTATTVCRLAGALSDVTMMLVIGASVAGPTFRPFLAVATALLLRLAVTSLGAVPGPSDSSWDDSAVASVFHVFVVPEATNRFLAPRVLLAAAVLSDALRSLLQPTTVPGRAVAATGPSRAQVVDNAHRWAVVVLAACALAFQASVSLALHTHWSMDLLLCLVIAHATAAYAHLLAPVVDAIMP